MTIAELRVVLVNYRCFNDIAKQLASDTLADADVVIVDNDSDPDAVSALAEQHGCQAVLMPQNVGFAAAVNEALALPESPGRPHTAVLLLNPDVAFDRGQLEALQDRLEATGSDAVAPVLVDERGLVWVSSAGGPMTLRSVIWYFAGLSHAFPGLSGFFWTRRQIRSPRPARPHWLCGACLMVRRSAFDKFGPLPTDEIVYGEDVGWGVDATAKGGNLRLARDIVIVHAGGGSGGSAAWVGATARTIKRRLGPVRGRLAVGVMQIGLLARRLLRAVMR